nr:MAG TPA: hypothetical protein [Caudoviricetes sp.]
MLTAYHKLLIFSIHLLPKSHIQNNSPQIVLKTR